MQANSGIGHRVLAPLVAAVLLTSGVNAEDSNAPRALDAQHQWSQWRGPLATGAAPHANPPVEWSEEKNVRWKVAIPGRGHSTPIVWGERIFLTAAVAFGEKMEPRYSDAPGAHDNLPISQNHQFVVLCVGRSDGKLLWRKDVQQALPHEGGHHTASLASHSPVADAEHVLACFGSQGIYCLDHDGDLVWKAHLGTMHSKHGHGEGSSPVLHNNTLVVNWDHEGQSFVVALDKRTGKQLWKRQREEVTSWSTPIVVDHEGKPQVVISGTNRVRSYDLTTGEVVWECGGMSANIVASPVAGGGMVFAASSYEKQALLAIRLAGAKGDVTGSEQVVWQRRRGTPYVPSPLLYGGSLYFLRHYQGILSRVDATTGEEPVGPFRLPAMRDIYASPVAAADRVYITGRDGTTLVIAHVAVPRPLALNRLDDAFNASAALVGREMFLRGERFLYAIAAEEGAPVDGR